MSGNLRTTTAEADAILQGRRADSYIAGDQVTRFWSEINSTVADTLVTTLRGVTSVATPKADNQTLAGTWAVSDVWQDEGDRRWSTIFQKLTKINALSGSPIAADLPTPIEMARDEIVNAFDLQEGHEHSIGYQYLHMAPGVRDDLMDLDVSSLEPSGAGDYAEKDRDFKIEEAGDRTGTLVVLWQKVVWPNALVTFDDPTDSVTSGFGGVQRESGAYSRTDLAEGVDRADEEKLVARWSANNDSGMTGFHVTGVRAVHLGAGGSNVIRNLTHSGTNDDFAEGILNAWEFVIGYSDVNDTNVGVVIDWPLLSPAAATTLVAALKAGDGGTDTAKVTWGGVQYNTIRIARQIQEGTGLVTVRWRGRHPYEEDLLQIYTPGTWPDYKIFVVSPKQWSADSYVVHVHRRITTTVAAACTWAEDSDFRWISRLATPGDKGGSVQRLTKLGLYLAFKEEWNTGSTIVATALGAPDYTIQ